MKRAFILRRTYAHPVEKVWAALTDGAALSVWLMPTTDFAAEVGRDFQFRTAPGPGFDGVVRCRVLTLDPPRTMRWSWRGGPVDTVVSFELEPLGPTSSRLTLTQSGFTGLPAVLVSFMLGSGARRIYGRALPAYLDRRSGAPVTDLREPVLLAAWHRLLAAAVTATGRGRARR